MTRPMFSTDTARSHELPELLIGLGVLGIGPVGFGFITVGELCVAKAPGLAQLLIGTGLAAMSVGSGAKYVFNWRVYHPRDRGLRALVVTACLMLVVCFVWEYAATGFRTLVRPVPATSSPRTPGGCLLWGSGEALRYWDRMRRRVRLQLADPVVSNRFLLWGFGAGAAGVGTAVGGVMQWWTQLPPIEMPEDAALLVAARPRRGGRNVARLRSQRQLHALDPGPLGGLIGRRAPHRTPVSSSESSHSSPRRREPRARGRADLLRVAPGLEHASGPK